MYVSQHVERIVAKCIVQNIQRICSPMMFLSFCFSFSFYFLATIFIFAVMLILENCLHGIVFGTPLNAFEFGMRGFPRPVCRAQFEIMRFYNAPFNVAITLVHFRRNIFEKRERQSVKRTPLKWKHVFHMNVFAVIKSPRSIVS